MTTSKIVWVLNPNPKNYKIIPQISHQLCNSAKCPNPKSLMKFLSNNGICNKCFNSLKTLTCWCSYNSSRWTNNHSYSSSSSSNSLLCFSKPCKISIPRCLWTHRSAASTQCSGNTVSLKFLNNCKCKWTNRDHRWISTSNSSSNLQMALWIKIISKWWCLSASKPKEANRHQICYLNSYCPTLSDTIIQMVSKDSRWKSPNNKTLRCRSQVGIESQDARVMTHFQVQTSITKNLMPNAPKHSQYHRRPCFNLNHKSQHPYCKASRKFHLLLAIWPRTHKSRPCSSQLTSNTHQAHAADNIIITLCVKK